MSTHQDKLILKKFNQKTSILALNKAIDEEFTKEENLDFYQKQEKSLNEISIVVDKIKDIISPYLIAIQCFHNLSSALTKEGKDYERIIRLTELRNLWLEQMNKQIIEYLQIKL
jgi:ABC-type transport system involved in cytochrome c biogenesis ATPase subunit